MAAIAPIDGKRSFWRRYLFVLILLLVVFVMDHPDVLRVIPILGAASAIFEPQGTWYRVNMAFIPRPVEASYVTLVTFTGTYSPECELRGLIAKLAGRLKDEAPAMVVSDIGFANDKCPRAPETNSLIQNLKELSRTTPIVIGEGARSVDEIAVETEDLKRNGFQENDLLLTPTLEISSPSRIQFGLMRLNADLRRVPIRWTTHTATTSPPVLADSLSYAAAKQYRSTFPDQGRQLEKLEAFGQHPFVSLLKERDFPSAPAIRLICNKDHVNPGDWKTCADNEGDPDELVKVHGRILVLGFDDIDQWSTYVGKLPGFVLHANYLEALLDQRVYRALPPVVEGVTLTLVVWLIHFLLIWPGFTPWKALALSGTCWGIALLLIHYVLLVNFSILFDLTGLGSAWLAAIGLRVYAILESKVHES